MLEDLLSRLPHAGAGDAGGTSTWPAGFFPLTSSSDLHDFDNVILPLLRSACERASVAGHCVRPRPSHIFNGGIVPTNVSETSFTLRSTWYGGDGDVSGPYWNPWNGTLAAGVQCASPAPWYVVFDHLDPTKVVKALITGWQNPGQLRYQNVRNSFVSGEVDAQDGNSIVDVAAKLAGRRFYFIGYDGLWYSDRVPEWSNGNEYASGTVTAYADAPAGPTTTLLRDDQANWKGDLTGKDLLVYGTDSFADGRPILHRVKIAGNTGKTISFAAQLGGWIPKTGTAYVVVGAGRRALPGRVKHALFDYYRGLPDSFASHSPDDALGGASVAKGTLTLSSGTDCAPAANQVFDFDLWSDQFDDLQPPTDSGGTDCLPCNRSYNPNLYKAWPRGIQLMLEDASPGYVAADGGGVRVPNLCPATAFQLAGINAFTGTAGAPVGGVPNNQISVSGLGALPYYPIQVHWCIRRTDWQQDKSGHGVMLDATTLEDSGFGTPFDTTDTGMGVVISLGWTRFVERRFRYKYAIDGVFIPDVKSDGFGGFVAVDPASVTDPDCTQPGKGVYYKRAASTKYTNCKEEEQSWSNPQGFARETGPAFVSGEYARYVGDNWSDPTVVDNTGTYLTPADPLANYWRRFYTGTLTPANQAVLDGQRGGRADDGGTFWLRDASKNFFKHGFFTSPMRTESGTATGGTTTSLTDTGKSSGTANCYWAAARFNGFSGAYVGFTIEILLSGSSFGDPLAVIARRLITSSSSSAISASWSEALPAAVTAGMQYRIKEPYRLNYWKDRTIKLFPAGGGAAISATVTGHNDDTIFFSPAVAGGLIVGKGWSWAIVDEAVGTVWKWTGTKWVAPSGHDAVRLGVSAAGGARDFLTVAAGQAGDQPSFAKRYGRAVPGEAMCLEVYKELYNFINALKVTRASASWTADPRTNNSDGSSGIQDSPVYDSSCVRVGWDGKHYAEAGWGGAGLSNVGGSPYAFSQSHLDQFGDPCAPNPPHPCGTNPADGCSPYSIGRQKGIAQTSACERVPGSATFYNYAAGPGGVDTQTCPAAASDVIFNNFGDSAAYKTWTSFGGGGLAGGTAQASMGSLGMPSGQYNFPGNCACRDRSEGYEVIDQMALITWAFTYHA